MSVRKSRALSPPTIVIPERFQYLVSMVNVAAALIVNDRSEILLCQRRKDLPYPHKWEFPGGKVKGGESPEECLGRELEEELGILCRIGPLYATREYTYPDSGAFRLFFFLIPSFLGTIENRVFEDVRWVPLREIPSYDILEGNSELVSQLMLEYGQG